MENRYKDISGALLPSKATIARYCVNCNKHPRLRRLSNKLKCPYCKKEYKWDKKGGYFK